MLRLTLLLALLLQAPGAPHFDSNRAWEHLRQMVAIGPRPAGSPAIEDTRKYIKAQLAAQGVAVAEQAWDDQTPLGKTHMVNLIATIPGAIDSDRPGNRHLAGHYDTKRIREFRFVGARRRRIERRVSHRDGARAEGQERPLTMELLFLDGEEAVIEWQGNDHTYGSRHYVEAGKRDGTLSTIKANILVDMIGDRDLRIKRDGYSTPWLTDIIWNAAKRAKLDTYFVPRPRASKTTTCRSSKPACRRWTSSTSTPRRGTRRRTTSTPSARAACRSSATSCSPRCRRSKRASTSRRRSAALGPLRPFFLAGPRSAAR